MFSVLQVWCLTLRQEGNSEARVAFSKKENKIPKALKGLGSIWQLHRRVGNDEGLGFSPFHFSLILLSA